MTQLKQKKEQHFTNRTRDENKEAAAAQIPGFSSWIVILFSARNDFKNITR